MRIKLFLIAVLLFIALPLTIANYANTSRYKPASNQVTIVSNSQVLRDVLPADVTNYVLAKINRYNNSLETKADAYTIADGVISRGVGNYNFDLTPDNSSHDIPVIVKVVNYGGLLSITVKIDGVVQDIS